MAAQDLVCGDPEGLVDDAGLELAGQVAAEVDVLQVGRVLLPVGWPCQGSGATGADVPHRTRAGQFDAGQGVPVHAEVRLRTAGGNVRRRRP